MIRPAREGEAQVCEEILRSLPEWFGIESSIVEYCRDLKVMETLVAEEDDQVVGLLTLNTHNEYTTEVHLMAVRSEWHRRGVGQALLNHAEQLLRSRSVEFLEVKTLGPSRPDANYEGTRCFYLASGFRPIEENLTMWDENPCLIMVKHLRCR